MQPHLEATKLVFIDETGATTSTARRRGRSPPGKRCRASVSHGHWKTTTLVCGLRLDGLTAPMVIDGAMDGAAFRAYASTLLGPSLRVGDIVVLANLAAHKVQGVREALGESGATLLYLPPYSPDFNLIEQAYAKLKALLRKAAHAPLTDWSRPSPRPWRRFHLRNAPTTSPMQDIKQYDPNML